jgi:hypothetical protein
MEGLGLCSRRRRLIGASVFVRTKTSWLCLETNKPELPKARLHAGRKRYTNNAEQRIAHTFRLIVMLVHGVDVIDKPIFRTGTVHREHREHREGQAGAARAFSGDEVRWR